MALQSRKANLPVPMNDFFRLGGVRGVYGGGGGGGGGEGGGGGGLTKQVSDTTGQG